MKLLLDMKALRVTVTTPFFSSISSEGFETFENDTIPDISVTAFLGTQVFATSLDGDIVSTADREAIGQVSDLIFMRDGQIKAVVLDVSAYTGTPNKQIDIDLKSLVFAADPADPNHLVLCVKADENLLRKLSFRKAP